MRTHSRLLIGFLGVVAILAVLDSKAEAQVYGGRQYYSFWNTAPSGDYYYREYYFKPAPSYTTYVVHQVHYYPQHPHYCYYYNPQSQTYWGRVPVERNGKAMYSLLKPEDRKGDLEEIPESAFPEPTTPPPLPGSEDNTKIAMPPPDLPPQVAKDKKKGS